VGLDKQVHAVLLAIQTRSELLNLRRSVQWVAFVVGAAAVLVGLAIAFWAASRVTRPVRRLADSVRRVAAGDWDTRADIPSRDEIGQLAKDFNTMTEQLVNQRNRMLQAERVAAWREIARRLAHELKNPLFPLQITVENLRRAREVAPGQFDEIFDESTSTLLAELNNLKTIIGRFGDFARMPAPQVESVDLNAIARESMRVFQSQLESAGTASVTTHLELAPELPEIRADPEQLRQVLRNLALNALDAMPKGGDLTIRTARRNGRVIVEVSDTGEGLTPEEKARLFTPYYTTKQHGTGLGLAIVQSVVSDHGGTISVDSAPGQGSTFRIELRHGPERVEA
jgi:two-component system, NtrC family, nitrogen regulation sensor histidine kinase NtrY